VGGLDLGPASPIYDAESRERAGFCIGRLYGSRECRVAERARYQHFNGGPFEGLGLFLKTQSISFLWWTCWIGFKQRSDEASLQDQIVFAVGQTPDSAAERSLVGMPVIPLETTFIIEISLLERHGAVEFKVICDKCIEVVFAS